MKKKGTKTPKSDRGQLGFKRGQFVVPEQLPGDHPGREAAEEEVEAEAVSQPGEGEDQNDRPAHGELGAVLQRSLEDRNRALRHSLRKQRNRDGGGDKREQGSARREGCLRRQEQRQQQYGSDLAHRAGR